MDRHFRRVRQRERRAFRRHGLGYVEELMLSTRGENEILYFDVDKILFVTRVKT